ncbi:MAG: hypothetical protein VZS44_02420 [Bacilli bacterium]|nr:hypothetical protein [Bacilli bacterium]
MKKFMKTIRKIPKKMVAIILVAALILNYFIPITKVFADGEYVLTFTIGNNNQNSHVMVNDNGHLKIDNQFVELRNGDNNIGTVNCASETTCTITVTNGQTGKLNYNGNNTFTLFMQGHPVSLDFNFSANENIAVQDYYEEHHDEGQGEESRFDGRAVVLWSCGSGVCYHEFDNIPDFPNGNSTFYKDSIVTADNKQNTIFDVHAQYKGWYKTDEFNNWQELYEIATGNAIDWNTLNPELILGEPNQRINELEQAAAETCGARPQENSSSVERNTYERCIHHYAAEVEHKIWTHKLQPVGEPSEANAYVSFGDRNFKVVIYNDDYRGITTGDLSGLNYYPAHWNDPFLKIDQYDISNTTQSKPAKLESILLESTIKIDALNYNGLEIASIEPLDVPEDAVTVTKNGNKFSIEFSSHFYDNVVFLVTDTHNEKYYIQVKRYTIDGYIRYDNERNIPVLAADFYFDRTKSYQDFIITAKIVYKDGSNENVTLNPISDFLDGLGNPVDGYEFDQENPDFEFSGKGLKMSRFEFDLQQNADRNIKDVYLNAEYKGSDTYTYAGAYSGSGEGTLANIYHPEEGE